MSARRLGAGIAGAAALIAVVTAVARVVGFGRWLAQSAAVGQTCVGTAYATANQLPNVLYEVVAGGALAAAVVPLLAGPLARGAQGRADVDRIASALLTWTVLVLLPCALALALAARPLVAWLVEDRSCEGLSALAVRMLVVFAPQVVLYGVGVVLTGVLQAHRRFAWPAVAPLASSLVVVASYAGFAAAADGRQQDPSRLSAVAEGWLAWGTTAGVAALTLPLLVPVVRSGVRLRPTLRFPGGVARRARVLAAAGVVTLAAQQVSVLTVLWLTGSTGPVGSLNVVQYTQAVFLLPFAVLAVPLATAAFPRLAERAATGDREGFARTAAGTTRAVLLVGLLGSAVLAGVAGPVEATFAGIDASGAAPAMAPALVAIAPALVGMALVAHLGRALNALERSRRAAAATSVGWLVVAVGSVVAAGALPAADTVVAVSLGTTVGMSLAGALLVAAVRSAAGPGATAGLLRSAAAGTLSAVVAALAGSLTAGSLLAVGGRGVPVAVGSGLAAGAVVLAVLGAGVALLDRSTVVSAMALLRGRRVPAPTPGHAGTTPFSGSST
jgi:putative peptidoglycan lipid II flippase